MVLKEIENGQVYYHREFRHGKIKEEDWHRIAGCKNTFTLFKDRQEEYIYYPGFVSDKKEIIKEYDKLVYSKFNNELIVPPRGNLCSNLSHIVCGIKPGHFNSHLSKISISWLIGPSSKMLSKLLLDVDVYPYFTNVYKNNNNIYGTIIDELEFLFNKFSNVEIIFLGSYKEYDNIVSHFQSKNKNIKYKKIWHPSYLIRAYTNEKYEKWKKSFLG